MRPMSLGMPLLFAGCMATVPTTPAVNPNVQLRPETRPECAARCEEMGMRLGAVVLIMNAEGCVCEPHDAPGSGARAAATVVSGAVLVRAQQEALEQQMRNEEERQRREAAEQEQRQRDSNIPATPPVPSL